MALKEAELAIHRKGTARFIDADLTEIVLRPIGEQWVDGTKRLVPQSPRPLQKFKIIWPGDNGIVRPTPNGVRKFSFYLLGNYDAVVEIGDTFSIGTEKFVIEYVFPDNGYEVKAGGNAHGSKPTG